ncbi:MAG: 3-phosphoshikimate 1-carboxyvinyltransferase [Rhodospirillales bacterium]|nr:3-phosphoshikimate 1-carboxyvinyltransferase [Rhodospirillales bacterium]
MTQMISRPVGALSGRIVTPGDKSISHRALILGASAVGETTVSGLLEAEDVLATATALRALGADCTRSGGQWRIHGRGVGGLAEPDRVLDMGNSGTGARLLMGLVASHPFTTFFTGDASLRGRPMRRVIEPLAEMGAAFWSRSNGRLPLAVRGAVEPLAIDYTQSIASAQVKSAIMLAAMNTPGHTSVVEPARSRDHTERMLTHFGADVSFVDAPDGGRTITLVGQPELGGCAVEVPGDISSAAFPLVGALIIPGSRLALVNVGVNPLRTGLIETLQEMGGRIEAVDARELSGEPVADLVVEAGDLVGVDVPAERVPRMIDEFPILAVAAACARGRTRMSGLGELRVKESDRLAAMVEGLVACGVNAEAGPDWIVIDGVGGALPGGARIRARHDHRIAMAFLVAGAAAREAVAIDDGSAIATSFPGFCALMNEVGADMSEAGA